MIIQKVVKKFSAVESLNPDILIQGVTQAEIARFRQVGGLYPIFARLPTPITGFKNSIIIKIDKYSQMKEAKNTNFKYENCCICFPCDN